MDAANIGPIIGELVICGPIGRRVCVLPATCHTHEGHTHNYDHTMMVVQGRLKVTFRDMVDGKLIEKETKEYSADEELSVAADRHHTVKALEDGTRYYCVFSHRDFNGLVSQRYVGNVSAYA